MTALCGAGRIRRFLKDSAKVPRPPTVPPTTAALEGKPANKVWRIVIGAAFRLYRLLLKHRRRIGGVARMASRWADAATLRVGVPLLRFANGQIVAGRRWLAKPALFILQIGLVLVIQLHLAASRKDVAIVRARILNLLFRQKIRERRSLAANAYFATLSYCGDYDRICAEVRAPETIDSDALNLAIGVAHMYRLHDLQARFYLERAARSGSAKVDRKLGCAHLLAGRVEEAKRYFVKSVTNDPRSVMAHQNNAGFYDVAAYAPAQWELDNAGELLIYDNFIQLGEAFYHQGRYDDTFRCYAKALDIQEQLAAKWSIPADLIDRIAAQCPSFNPSLPIRLLGYEWVTLVGHFGFLDSYIRMSKLGMIGRANYVLLAPESKVANQPLFGLFESLFCVARDTSLVDDLLPYQRLIGDQFMAFRSSGELAEPWPHAAARAQVTAAEQECGAFVHLTPDDIEWGRSILKQAGVPLDAFIVCLHIREGGFHGDGAGSTRAHRSADIETYVSGIREITSRGGWIIRLGDRSMTAMPRMPNVFDYALSPLKSARMDVFLLATCALYIGTTSGLTSAAQIFRRPMLLVNCISNDAQYWTGETSFIVKRVYDNRRRRYLSLHETYNPAVQPLLIDQAVMRRHGLEAHSNSDADIRSAIVDKLDSIFGHDVETADEADLMRRYRASIGNSYLFGAAKPSVSFLKAYAELLT